MRVFLRIALLCVVCAGAGWLVMTYCPVVGAGSSVWAPLLWALAFASPMLLVGLVVWVRMIAAGHLAGPHALKVAFVLFALRVVVVVMPAGDRRIRTERERILRETGLDMAVQ